MNNRNDDENILFFGTFSDLKVLLIVIENCLAKLAKSTNPRETVLETWLALDFALRQFLLSGFELTRFCDEDFDLRYNLLPRSFSALLRLFEDTVEYVKRFPLEPATSGQDKIGGFRASYAFWRYIKDKHKALYDKIVEVNREYLLEINPELRNHLSRGKQVAFFTPNSPDEPKGTVENINIEWRKAASKFDESWFKLAKQLNTARNIAVHSFDADKIGRPLGLTGVNSTELIRDKCHSILSVLLTVRIDQD